MSPDRWEQISEIYHAALEIDSRRERAALLEKACAGDAELRREVESLLAADSEAGDFIAEPIVEKAALQLALDRAPSVSLAGKQLGHYKILSKIGRGGMGEVYLAKDTRLNRRVAVKTLPLSFTDQSIYLRRFQIEAQAAATLNHPNAAIIYSVEEIDGLPFYTMEYVEGKTLDAVLPAGGLDLKTFFAWFTQLAEALCHAHEKGVVHRDIKPGNIMITRDGAPKILDFGLAQIDEEIHKTDGAVSLQFTDPGQIFGTPSYMSPEQAEGRHVDARSDIFSFGVVMYQAITGERPFKGDSYASIVSQVLTKEPRPISELKPETPFPLVRLIERCLDKDRERRWKSMRELQGALQEMKAALETGASIESGAGRQLATKAKTFSRALLFAFVAALVAAAFGVYYFYPSAPGAPPISFENAAMRKLSQTNNVVYAHLTPDGKSLAFNTIEENDNRALWIRRVEDKNALNLLPPQKVQFWGGITVSHDGNHLYYITAVDPWRHGTLYRIASLGGTPRKLAETVNDLGGLSPDGQRILYVRYRYDERMELLSANAADGSDERLVYSADPAYIFRDPQFSHDGKSIFFIKFERINGEEFWSLVEVPAEGGDDRREKVIIPKRKPRISETIVLRDGSGLYVNATDAVSNLAQLYHVSLPDGKETRITNDLNTYFGISASADGQSIVSAQRNTIKDIWTVSGSDRETLRKLTNESNVYLYAHWTPDGKIVFDALDNNRPHIWIMNGDGTGAQQLTPNDSFDYEPRVSPDGRFIVFTSRRGGDTKIWRMNADGSNPQLLTPVAGAAFGPAITPDGKWVLFQWIKDTGKVMGRVPLVGGEVGEHDLYNENTNLLSISPDGARVAHVFFDGENKRYKVRVRPLETSEPSTVFDISPGSFLLWTRDGKSLLYRDIEVPQASHSTIWQQFLAGGAPKQFLNLEPDYIFSVSLSNDGARAVLVRGRYETDAVMLTRVRPPN